MRKIYKDIIFFSLRDSLANAIIYIFSQITRTGKIIYWLTKLEISCINSNP